MVRSGLLCLIVLLITAGGILLVTAQEEMPVFPDEYGYTPLLGRRNIEGWTMQWPGIWNMQRGTLVGKQDPAEGGDSWLFTDDEWDDFALELEFNMTENCNSGVGIRMPKGVEGRPSQYGYEIQISDVDDEYPTGSIFRHVAANQKLHKSGWNLMGIVCVRDHIVVYLNHQKVVDARLEGSKKGRIGLQVHGTEKFKDQVVRFRNVKIKDLKPQYKAEPSPVKFQIHQIDDSFNEGDEVVDINKDGVLDITCGSNWYEGPDWKPHKYRNVRLSGEFANNYGEIGMDVNKDGWMDIISGGWFVPEMIWYENPGSFDSDTMWKEHIIVDDFDGTETIFPFDIDRDGQMDILANRYNTQVPVAFLRYVGLEKSPSGFQKINIGYEGRGHGEGVGDINSDGRNDIVCSQGWYECPPKPDTQKWTWHPHMTYEPHEAGIPILVDDFNEDGLPDILQGEGHRFKLRWIEQTKDSAGRQAWIHHEIDNTVSQLHSFVYVDLDGDGHKDIITGKRYRGHSGTDPGANEPLCIEWFEVKKGKDPKFIKHFVTYDDNIGVGADLSVRDIDKDGDLDVISAGKTGLYLLENVTK